MAWQQLARPMKAGTTSTSTLIRAVFTAGDALPKAGTCWPFHMAHARTDFVTAAKALGCWVEDGKPSTRPPRPAQLSPRDALSLIADDANYLAIFTGLLVNGKDLTESDREAALDAVARILKITGMYQ